MPERMRHLESLSAALGDAVTVEDVARATLAELLSVTDVVRAGLAVSRGAGRDLTFVSSDEEAMGPLGVRWCTIDGLADVPLARTVRTGEPVYLPSDDALADQFPEIAPRQRRLGTRAMASVPMVADGSCVGGLLVSYGVPQEYPPEQRAFLSAFAAQVSQALRRGLAYQVQRSTSEQLQRSLMPHSVPELPGLALGAHYQPGGVNVDVGGDWYDVLPLPDGSAVVTLGDVMGRGVDAAIVMGEVRAATRAYALLDPEPAVVLDRLDRLITTLPFGEQVVTMVYGLVDADRSSVRIGSAGHLPPLLVPRSGRPSLLDRDLGPALGIGAGPWRTHTVPLTDGSGLLFYSDGLVENHRQELFAGIDALRDHVEQMQPRRRNPRELCARLCDLMLGRDVDDDVTMLALTACAPQPTAARELPADSTAASLARRFVTSVLRDWAVHEDVVDTAELCVSELVTNAVIHSRTTSRVTVRRDDEYLVVMVQDRGGVGLVHQADDTDPEAISGRGLSLVDALASAWRAEHNADGTTVWFELALDPSASTDEADTWSHLAS